jgi:PAS domain-containing protein
LGLGSLLAGYQSRWIAGSIQALIAPALALGRGEVPNIPRLEVQEADDVAQALDRASRLLQSRTVERNDAQQQKQEAETARTASERRIEETKTESDHWLRKITDNISEGLVFLSMTGRLLHCNKAARELLGFGTEHQWMRKLLAISAACARTAPRSRSRSA